MIRWDFLDDCWERSSAFYTAWWSSIHLLCRIFDIRCCMKLVLILVRVFDTYALEMLRLLYRDFTKGMCVVLHAHTILTIGDLTINTSVAISSIKDWYFSIFSRIVRGEYQSLQYMNLINCTIMYGICSIRVLICMGVQWSLVCMVQLSIALTSLT